MIYGVLGSKIKLENGKGVQVKNFQLKLVAYETIFDVIQCLRA